MKKLLTLALALCLLLSLCAFPAQAEEPIKITMLFADNATMPFTDDWLVIKETEKRLNVDLEYMVVPYSDYSDKAQTMLTSNDAPDVIIYADPTRQMYNQFALNGSFVAMDDLKTPHFDKKVEEWGLKDAVDMLRLSDGKLYVMPALYSQSFYDGGLILRTDLLEKYGLARPTTFDELHNVMKVFKEKDPESYPLTVLIRPSVHYRMTMPSYGISLHANASTGSHVLSWDYEKKEYFAGATSDLFKQYVSDMALWYSEGLIDPEYTANPSDLWASKMSKGYSSVTYAYYDQIGGLIANSEIEGIAFDMLPPLYGPGGAHHQPKARTGFGIMFPTTTAKRADFDKIVAIVDEMYFSDEFAELTCLGQEGVTFTRDADGKVTFSDEILNSADGVYKYMQIKYGAGNDVNQKVWHLETELLKYDENYAKINNTVAQMDDAIQLIPPAPKFDDLQTEEANLLKSALADAFNQWIDEFIQGTKSVEKDWDEYVKALEDLGLNDMLEMYNNAR